MTATMTAGMYARIFPGVPEQVSRARHEVADHLNGWPKAEDGVSGRIVWADLCEVTDA